MRYICKRCAYGTNIKCNLINHLTRKKQCVATYIDIPRETLIEELEGKIIENAQECSKTAPELLKKLQNKEFCNISKNINPLECRYCAKIYSKTSNLKRNLETCKEKIKKEKLKEEETDLMKQLGQKDVSGSKR